jgi:hypothetical protein
MDQSQLIDVEGTGKDKDAKAPLSVVEGTDYYLEGGLMVFTERFLLHRGYCCESGCRHCPYGFSKNNT